MEMNEEDLTAEDLAILDGVEKSELDKTHNDTCNQTNQDNDNFNDFDFDSEFSNDKPQMEHLECLKSKFGHKSFRSKQWDIIRTIIYDKRDVCAVMSTGYGKSLCFQYPAVFTHKIVLVISPLIALMQAQVLSLNESNVSACLVGSAQKDTDILSKIKNGEFTVIYSSPEYLQLSRGIELLEALNGKLALIAIDEAHCVSQWGHDFRPDFRKLNTLRKILPNTPILAVTATATKIVRNDIISLLSLRNPQVVITSFDRPNLEFFVHQKSSYTRDLPSRVRSVNGSVIVYVLRRTDTEEIASFLINCGIICEPYHAGLDIVIRTAVLEKFLKGDLKVIVATIAFGMGIDKKDIRCVIHYGASKNLESYYQEVGRAGRDGKPAQVITFFNQRDFQLHDYFLNNDNKRGMMSSSVKAYLESLAMRMREFLYSKECRRKTILEYFGEETNEIVRRENCCDNCTNVLRSGSEVENKIIARIDGMARNNNITTHRYIPQNRSFQYSYHAQYAIKLMFGRCVNCRPSFYCDDSDDDGEFESFMSNGEEDDSNRSYDTSDDVKSNDEDNESDEEHKSAEEHESNEEHESAEEHESDGHRISDDHRRSDVEESSDEEVATPIKRRKIVNF